MQHASPTFLYVEDDPLSRRIMEILLKDLMGFSELTVFDNSSDLLAKLHALPAIPTVIFLDMRVRPHNGYEVLTMIKEEPHYTDVTVIAVTANVMANDVTHLRQAGFSGLVGKPIIKEVFPELIEKILARESVWFIP
jgi:CheY-like chemotaxis protein